jgi:hypothetical protein
MGIAAKFIADLFRAFKASETLQKLLSRKLAALVLGNVSTLQSVGSGALEPWIGAIIGGVLNLGYILAQAHVDAAKALAPARSTQPSNNGGYNVVAPGTPPPPSIAEIV